MSLPLNVSKLLYVYAILEADPTVLSMLERERLPGIDGQVVHAVAAEGLLAIVSAVPPEEFDTAVLNERVRDLSWLAPRAATNQAVNERLFALADAVLPLSFGTVFRDSEGVERLLRAEGQPLRDRVDRLRGQAEWVVTVQRDAATALAAVDQHSPELVALRDQLASAAPGRAYLLRRQLEQTRRTALARADDGATRQVLTILAATASAVYREDVPAAAAGETLARVSFLVPRTDEERWQTTVAQLAAAWAEQGYTIRVTGPWPPYRFSTLQPEAAVARAE